MNDTASLPGPAGPPSPQRVRVAHSLKAHSGLAKAVFLMVAVPGIVFAWFHGQPQYVAEAAIQVAPNFTTTLQEPDELRDQATRYQDFLQQQVLNLIRYEVLERALQQLGEDRALWQAPDESDAQAIQRLQELLEVEVMHGSFRINVALAGPRPEGLAEIVNAVVDSYLFVTRSEMLFAGDDRVKALENYRGELTAQMDADVMEKAAIAEQLGITSFDRTLISPMQAQVDDTTAALGEARRALITAKARLDALDAGEAPRLDLELVSQARLVVEQDAVLNDQASPLLTRRGMLQASLAGLTPENPAALVARTEIEEIDAELGRVKEQAAERMAGLLGQQRRTQAAEERLEAVGEVQRGTSLVASLEGELSRLQTQLGENNTAFERGRDLEADMDRLRRRIDEIDDRADMFKLESRSPGFARLDSPARTPESPSRGGRLKYILVFLVLAAGMAMGATVMADVMDQQIHRARDLERAFGFPPLGWVAEPRDGDAARQAEDQVRRLALAIEREVKRKGTRRFVITSVKPHARTAGLVRDLARELSATGVKVLSVAANVQDSSASASARGLVEALEQGSDPATLIVAGPPGHLPLGSANGLPRLPAAHRLGPVLDQAGRDYEVVLIHAPPLLLSSDAELLVSLSEATLLVIVAEEENLGEVRGAIQLLERLSPPAVGMVLTGVREPDGTSDNVT